MTNVQNNEVQEVAVIDVKTGEVLESQATQKDVVISETETHKTIRLADGTHVRKAKYQKFSSFTAQSRADKIWLLNVMESDEETGKGLKDCVGQTLKISHIITTPYDTLDEKTGALDDGVLTYLIEEKEDGTKEAYATSSKSVYFTIMNILENFGTPDTWENEPILLQVSKKKRENGEQILVKMIG